MISFHNNLKILNKAIIIIAKVIRIFFIDINPDMNTLKVTGKTNNQVSDVPELPIQYAA